MIRLNNIANNAFSILVWTEGKPSVCANIGKMNWAILTSILTYRKGLVGIRKLILGFALLISACPNRLLNSC